MDFTQQIFHQLKPQDFGPDMHENLDYSSSLDICTLKINNLAPLQTSFYTQWEIDTEDAEQKKILEEALGTGSRIESIGSRNEEGLLAPPFELFKSNGTNYFENASKNEGENDMSLIEPKLLFPIDHNLMQAFEQYVEKRNQVKQNNAADQKKNISSFQDSQQKGQNLGWIYQTEKNTHESNMNLHQIKNNFQTEDGQLELKREKSDLFRNDLAAQLGQKQNYEVQFNIMVVGESGVGKSTFIDCFLEKKYNVKNPINTSTKEIIEKQGVRNSDGLTFIVNFVDTPGYDYEMDMNKWYNSIENHIITQFEDFKLRKENSNKYNKNSYIKDKRIHMILYFSSGARMKKKDFYYIKKLTNLSNVIPVLAKGDSYTTEEAKQMKNSFLKEAQEWKIKWFDFHEALKDEKEKFAKLDQGKFGTCPPFLVIASTKKINIGLDQYMYGREYSWGVCNAEDPNHSDLALLQELLGGYVCFEAILQVHYYYKKYIKKRKQQQKSQIEEEKKKNVGICALVMFGVLGAFAMNQNKIKL